MRLAQPPPPRLAVPPPTNALLTDRASTDLAGALAIGLQNNEVPAVAAAPKRTDWRLIVTADQRAGEVVPIYTVENPKGEAKGSSEGKPVPLAAWAGADAATLAQTASEAAPTIAALLTRIEAARQHADPNSLLNRPAKVAVVDVEGAPGDGNASLTRQMRRKLSQLGPVVQDTATGADFIVEGHVRIVPEGGGLDRVEIQWVLKTAAGDERGRVIQLNEVPSGSLNRYWGDVAVVVADQGANGLEDALTRQTGRETGRK